ncbi:hypothetical protein BDZ97DRAFT_260503 [Flammula alnicola]|nr:hypothetical protein BDZ97DRAFT_260503 [Flammula alnicola]
MGLITTLVQWFFAYRVWSILPSPWRYVGLVCALAALARLAMSIYVGIEVFVLPNAMAVALGMQPVTTALFMMGALIDVTIAISMVYFLIQKWEKGLSRVTRLIDRLIGFSIRTGLVTSIAAVVVLILYRLMPFNLIYFAMYASLAKLYSNSLLSAQCAELLERYGVEVALRGSSAANWNSSSNFF